MILSEAAYNLLNLLRGGRSTNNEYYSLEQIKFNIQYYRALLIRRDANRWNNSRLYDLEQDLGNLPVEMVDPSEGGLASFRGHVLRTTKDIPTPIRLPDHSGITFVGSPDRRYAYPLIEFHEARWQKENKYTGKKPKAYLLNRRIHVIGIQLVEEIDEVINETQTFEDIPEQAFLDYAQYVTVRGIFEDPRAAHELATDEEFDDDTTDYPLPLDMMQRITQSLLSGEFKVLTDTTPDHQADQVPDS